MRRSLFPQNFFALIPLCGLALLILSSRTSSAFPKIPEEQGARNLEEYAKTYSNREEWQARAKKIRAGILEGSRTESAASSYTFRKCHSLAKGDGWLFCRKRIL